MKSKKRLEILQWLIASSRRISILRKQDEQTIVCFHSPTTTDHAINSAFLGEQSATLALHSLNLLIGPNGSGKSNLIEAISVLRATTDDLRSMISKGGGDSKELHARCREGFRKLLEKSGFKGRMPRLVACGGRGATFDDFKTGHSQKRKDDFVAMLIDSEIHLQNAEGWTRTANVADEQVLLMTTCMESWIVADRRALRNYYGSGL